jgi:hypothetical protein
MIAWWALVMGVQMPRPLSRMDTHRLRQPWLKSSHLSVSQGLNKLSCYASSWPTPIMKALMSAMFEIKHETTMWNSWPLNRRLLSKRVSRWNPTISFTPLSPNSSSSTIQRIKRCYLQPSNYLAMPKHGGSVSLPLVLLTKCSESSFVKLSVHNKSQQALWRVSIESSWIFSKAIDQCTPTPSCSTTSRSMLRSRLTPMRRSTISWMAYPPSYRSALCPTLMRLSWN